MNIENLLVNIDLIYRRKKNICMLLQKEGSIMTAEEMAKDKEEEDKERQKFDASRKGKSDYEKFMENIMQAPRMKELEGSVQKLNELKTAGKFEELLKRVNELELLEKKVNAYGKIDELTRKSKEYDIQKTKADQFNKKEFEEIEKKANEFDNKKFVELQEQEAELKKKKKELEKKSGEYEAFKAGMEKFLEKFAELEKDSKEFEELNKDADLIGVVKKFNQLKQDAAIFKSHKLEFPIQMYEEYISDFLNEQKKDPETYNEITLAKEYTNQFGKMKYKDIIKRSVPLFETSDTSPVNKYALYKIGSEMILLKKSNDTYEKWKDGVQNYYQKEAASKAFENLKLEKEKFDVLRKLEGVPETKENYIEKLKTAAGNHTNILEGKIATYELKKLSELEPQLNEKLIKYRELKIAFDRFNEVKPQKDNVDDVSQLEAIKKESNDTDESYIKKLKDGAPTNKLLELKIANYKFNEYTEESIKLKKMQADLQDFIELQKDKMNYDRVQELIRTFETLKDKFKDEFKVEYVDSVDSWANIDQKNIRNVALFGKTRSGKSVFVRMLLNPFYIPHSLSIFSETRAPLDHRIIITHNNTRYGIHIVDPPGLFEKVQMGSKTVRRSDERLLQMTLDYIRDKLKPHPKLNNILFFYTTDQGIQDDDIAAFDKYIESLQIKKDNFKKLGAFVISRAEDMSENRKNEVKEQIQDHPYFGAIVPNENILFTGALDNNAIDELELETTKNDLTNIIEYRAKLIQHIIDSDPKAAIDIPLAETSC